jgi:SAM-dependent methyltransferase
MFFPDDKKQEGDSFIRPFEWLTNAVSLKSLLIQHAVASDGDRQSSPNGTEMKPLKALHVGSGCSVLGEFLVEELHFEMVVNTDKDEETMKKMEERWLKRSHESTLLERLKFCIIDFAKSPFPYQDSTFDMVLDKSTLDCTLCSDHATASLLLEVYRCLAVGGCYLLISYNDYDLMLPLLNKLPGAHWDIIHSTMQREVENIARINDVERIAGVDDVERITKATATSVSEEILNDLKPLNVFVCRKTSSGGSNQLDFDAVCQHVYECNDAWFQQHQPLLTRTRKEAINTAFEHPLELSQAYQELFTDGERDNLTFEHFLEDWNAFCESNDATLPKDSISSDTALKFLEEMQ